MKYRTFGSSGVFGNWSPSALGFGAMRFPLTDPEDYTSIDRERAAELLDCALENGVNLIDTAYPYHGQASESFLGEYLTPERRRMVKLCTKMPSWKIGTAEDDFDRYFDEQLEKLRSDCVDIYLLHALNEKWWSKLRDLGVLRWAERRIEMGQIGTLGFSFHDRNPVFRSIVDAWDGWSCCLIQYNYMDVDRQAGVDGLRYAHEKGLAVMVMEPLRGGQLARRVPVGVAGLLQSSPRKMSPVEWALQWIWSQPEVSLVLSGMGTLEEVRQNIEYAGRSATGLLGEEDEDLIDRVRREYRTRMVVPCTQCGYCMPCPSEVEIPHIFDLLNSSVLYDDLDRMRTMYTWIGEEKRADRCTSCGECEEKCPQAVDITGQLARAHARLGPRS